MEYKIEVKEYESVNNVVSILLDAKARGEHVWCEYRGKVLHSDGATEDSLYKEILGCTKAELDRQMQELREKTDNEFKKIKEQQQKEILERTTLSEEEKKITPEKIIEGIKFIAENYDLEHKEIAEGLSNIGCNFTLKDIDEQFYFPEELTYGKALNEGNLGCGAVIIYNVRVSDFGLRRCVDRYLRYDNDTSIYHFIRTITKDETYTKENLDLLKPSNKKY